MKETRLVKLKEDILPLLLLLIFPVVYLNLLLFSEHNIIGSQYADIKSQFFYTRFFGFKEVSNFHIPLWNPYVFSGMPFVATLQSAIFYPFNLIFTVFPIVYAINWSIALHLFLSGAFTYYLLKYYGAGRFGGTVAAIVYTFSAPQVMHIYGGHLNVLSAMVWTPLMFLFLDRLARGDSWKYGIFLSFTIALQLLAGQPQYLFYSMIALSLYVFFLINQLWLDGATCGRIGKKGVAFIVFVVLGLALSAVQILPTAEMTQYSTRKNLSYEWVSNFSFPPENLITFLISDFFGDMIKIPYWGKNYLWEMSAYVGIMPLMLAVIAAFYVRKRVVWFFAGLAIISVILALGKYTPLLKLLYNYVPGFHLFRGNSKFIFLNAFSLAVLSGFGADVVVKRTTSLNKRFSAWVIGLGTFLIASLLVMHVVYDEAWIGGAINRVIYSGDLYVSVGSFMQPGFVATAVASIRNGILWTIGLATSGIALLLAYSYGKLRKKAFMAGLLVIIIFDLFTFGMRYMVTFDSREVYWYKEVVAFLKQDKEPFRVIAPRQDRNSGMASGIETLGGYDTIMLKRYSEFINFSQELPPDTPSLGMDIKSVNMFTDLLNARYLVIQSGLTVKNPGFSSIFDNGRHRIYRNLNALPRAFVVHDAKVVRDRDSIFRELLSPEFAPLSYAIVEEEPDIISPSLRPFSIKGKEEALPRFIEYSPNKVIIDASLAEPGLLVLGDVYCHGWKAFVDRRETRIYKTNYVMRGVALPAGRHTVEFRYDPLSFKIGTLISLTTLIFMIGFLVWNWRRNEKAEVAP